MSATQYPYTSLIPNTSIRLFTVEPELSNGYVSCTLRHFDGKECGDMISDGKECDGTQCDGEKCFGLISHGKIPPYSALSYVWGDSKHTRQIYLGDYLIGIHETLWEFLHQMQTTQEEKTWFWTDYLCLNQDDQTEMSEQVQRMGEIYSGAKETLAWLGREGSPAAKRVEDSTPVMNLEHQLTLIEERVDLQRAAVERFFAELPNWSTIMRYRLSGFTRLGLSGLVPVRYKSAGLHFRDQNLPQASNEVIQLGHGQLWVHNSLQDVLSLPYWTRVWIVQEVARARAVKLAFGSVSIKFDDFLLAYKSYAYYELWKLPLDFGWTIIGSKAAIEARAAVTENSLSMHQVLQWSRICQASRPVDRIYGLFGLLKAHGAGTFSNLESLTVDYNQGITSVFWDVVLSCRISTVGNETQNLFVDEMNQFLVSIPLLADLLGCTQAFSLDGLRCYSETVQDPSLRRMARLTSRMVHVLRQVGTGRSVSLAFEYDWSQTRDSAHKVRPVRKDGTKLGEFDLEMAALFLEYAELDDVGGPGEVHAAYVASKLARTAEFKDEWTCKRAHDHLDEDQWTFDDGRMRRMRYKIAWRRLPPGSGRLVGCCLLDRPTSPTHSGKHQCSGSSLFVCLSDPGFVLEVDLEPSLRRPTLKVIVNGHMR